jgi:hypothetical protein
MHESTYMGDLGDPAGRHSSFQSNKGAALFVEHRCHASRTTPSPAQKQAKVDGAGVVAGVASFCAFLASVPLSAERRYEVQALGQEELVVNTAKVDGGEQE